MITYEKEELNVDDLADRLKELKLVVCEWKEMYCGSSDKWIQREISSFYKALIVIFNDESEMYLCKTDLIYNILNEKVPILFMAASSCSLSKLESYVQTIMQEWCILRSNNEKKRIERGSPTLQAEQGKNLLYLQTEEEEERLKRIIKEVES